MKKRCCLSVVLILATLFLIPPSLMPRPAGAQEPDPNAYAKIMLNLVAYADVRGNKCDASKAAVACGDMKTAGRLNEPYYAFLLVTDGDRTAGIAGLQCGVDYNGGNHVGVDVFEWHLCATLQFPYPANGWGQPGSSNLITWDPNSNCQQNEPGGAGTGVVAVAGWFYLSAYTKDRMSVTVRPVDGAAKVADCAAKESIVEGPGAPSFSKSHLGYLEFSNNATDPGYNPCGQVKPVVNATWSDLKSRGGQ